MTTAYVAAEKFIHWNDKGQPTIDESLASAIASHRKNNRFVIFFAPARFGFWFEDKQEVEEAWHYLENALCSAGMHPKEVMLFDHEVDADRFVHDMQAHPNDNAVIVSDEPCDQTLSQTLGIRCIHEIPADMSGMWPKLSIRRILRTLIPAAFNV